MKDITREKYVRLMTEIENLEDFIAELEVLNRPDDSEITRLKQELASKRNELARLSDGCGKPHPTT
ncbi:MAG: hypothetical protein A2Y07_01485 [Planctomycetes bacterium GWF2_50_10]|nr:MAG: hypothetical protein A2Y07_01485 [Planctomycetes bacterium GWF2_50_10]